VVNTEITFRAIWVAPSIILSLGLTRLLSDFILVFKSRNSAELDWVPLAWAACIFVFQVQYLWAVIDLTSIHRAWTIYEFMLLISLSILLFVSAALVLPDTVLNKGESLTTYFSNDGRWALLALSCWELDVIIGNFYLFGLPVLSPMTLVFIPILVLPLAFLGCRSRKLRELITFTMFVYVIWSALFLSPKSYG